MDNVKENLTDFINEAKDELLVEIERQKHLLIVIGVVSLAIAGVKAAKAHYGKDDKVCCRCCLK